MTRAARHILVLAAALTPVHAWAEEAAGAAADGAKKGIGLPQFDPSSYPSQVFWLAITFAVLYIVFSKKTLPEIGGVLQKREEYVGGLLTSAKEQKERAEKLQAEYEAGLESARQEATKAYVDVEKAVKAKAEKQGKAFQEKAAEKTGATEKSIEKAKAGAMEDMQHLAAEIAQQAAAKIIGIEPGLDEAKSVVKSIKAKAA